MKTKIIIASIITAMSLSIMSACEIKITSDKSEYHVGDYAIFTVTIKQDHNNCLHEGEEPLLSQTGLELSGKTVFTETSRNTWEIKYKAKVTGSDASLTVTRECTKGGDVEKITLNVT